MIQQTKHRNPDTLKLLGSLQKEVIQLKEERSELYKTNAGNAQRVLTLMDDAKANENTINTLNAQIRDFSNENKSLIKKLSDRDDLLHEKDHVIQVSIIWCNQEDMFKVTQ